MGRRRPSKSTTFGFVAFIMLATAQWSSVRSLHLSGFDINAVIAAGVMMPPLDRGRQQKTRLAAGPGTPSHREVTAVGVISLSAG